MKKFLSKKIQNLPQRPGAYLFKDSSGLIIYIGKAVALRKRVKSHFTLRLGRSPRSGNNFFPDKFIDKITDIDWIKTQNESQALILENQLIKKYQPRFNIQWRDDKSYFWVRFSEDEWPRVMVVHKNKILTNINPSHPPLKIRGGSPSLILREGWGELNIQQPIGPFVNGRELRQVLRALRKVFPFRTCKNSYNKPCLQWHLGLCPAHEPSVLLSERGRRPSRRQIGNPSTSPRRLKTAGLRSGNKNNYLDSLSMLSQFLRLYAGEPIRIEAYDISNIQGNYATGSMIVFEGARPKKSDYRRFRIKTVSAANDIAMLKEVLRRRLNHAEWPYPDLILVDGGRAQLSAALQIANSHLRSAISNKPYAIIALAKKEEEIYTEFSTRALKIAQLPESLKLTLKHIRDEAHRFAIFYYRYLHAARDYRKSPKSNRKTRQSSSKT